MGTHLHLFLKSCLNVTVILGGRPKAGIFPEPVRNAIRLAGRIVLFFKREKYIKGLSLIKLVTVDEYLNRLSSLIHEHMKVRTIE